MSFERSPSAEQSASAVEYPYMHPQGVVVYERHDQLHMQMAQRLARHNALDHTMPNASLLVRDGQVLGWSANGSSYHDEHGCERVRLGMPTGQGYDLCEGCHPKHHSEPRAVQSAIDNGYDPAGAELYLWGHWWCCEPCWDALTANGVTVVHLLEGSAVIFNRETENNLVGDQFSIMHDPEWPSQSAS